MKTTYLLHSPKTRLKFIRAHLTAVVMTFALCLSTTTLTAQTITTSSTTNQYSLQAPAIVVDNSIIVTATPQLLL